MARSDSVRVIRGAGRIVVDPTDLSSADPYGGVEIGQTRAIVVQALGQSTPVPCEALGDITDVLESTHRYVVSFIVRTFDDDAVEQLLSSNYAEGSVSRRAKWTAPGAVPGQSALARSKKLLFVPDDPIHVPAMIAYNCAPFLAQDAEIPFQRQETLELPIAAECLRSPFGKTVQIARLSDLDLT